MDLIQKETQAIDELEFNQESIKLSPLISNSIEGYIMQYCLLRSLIIISTISLSGCFGIYPGWSDVKVENNIYGKPCKFKNREERIDDDNNDKVVWFKKRATKNDSDVIVVDGYYASYYQCKEGYPIVPWPENSVVFAFSKENNKSSEAFNKAELKCSYETNKSIITFNTNYSEKPIIISRSDQSIAGAYDNLHDIESQIRANEINKLDAENRARQLEHDKYLLFKQCLEVEGYTVTEKKVSTAPNTSNEAIELYKKKCPGIGIQDMSKPCFVPK